MSHFLEGLNPVQDSAARNYEGGGLALAGPGSGKTQTLASRIAVMLQETVTPNMILALTFTEAGVVAMRDRLTRFVGATAFQVAIHTFHSFCNEIIQGNPDYFGIREFEAVSELERIEISYRIIENLPANHILKRLRGDIYYDSRRLLNLFQVMKEENWSFEHVRSRAEGYLKELPEREEYIYKRGNKKRGIQAGDIKTAAIAKEKEKMDKLIGAAGLLEAYNEEMKKARRYDFTDMIQWVLKAWSQDDFFLLNYQERYQYVLVDEFQDTNRMQLDLLDKLLEFWDDPNIFAVGDDDQCLYEFSGARIQNIIDFREKYNPALFVFTDNYRSSAKILKHSENVINLNKERLINYIDLSKDLVAATDKGQIEPQVLSFPNSTMETSRVVRVVEDLKKQGQRLDSIGIIYRKHRQSDDLIRQFEARGIPYNVRRSINVLDTTIIKQLIDMISFIVYHDGLRQNDYDSLLFKILHFNFWNNDVMKIHKYYLSLQDKDARSRKPLDILETEKILSSLVVLYHNEPIVSLVNHILEDSGLMKWVINSPKYLQLLQYINTFFNWVKGESFKRPSMTGAELIAMINKMWSNGLNLPTVDVQGFNDGVNLMTVHGAKGLEYETVIMMGCNRNEWEGSRSGSMNFTLPDTLTLSVSENKLESNRRLFYVGMTRAERRLLITYADKNSEGKDLEPSQFIIESEIEVEKVESENLDDYLKYHFKSGEVFLNIEKKMIQSRLDIFTMSVSALNKYLECGITFYYENIIRVPFVAHAALVYGNAIHLVMQRLYNSARTDTVLNYKQLFSIFAEYMDKNRAQISSQDVELRMELGKKSIAIMLQDYFPISNKVTLNEFKIRRVIIDGVPCKGDIDKIEFRGNIADTIDYKTGNPTNAKKKMNPPTAKEENGGEYWRQKVLYKLMFDALPGKEWSYGNFRLDMIHEQGVTMLEQPVEPWEEDFMKKLIKSTHSNIMAGKFDPCGKDDCVWCNLIKQN